MKPALDRGLRKVGRDLLQVIAAGGAVGIVGLVTGHLSPEVAIIVAFGFKLLTVFAQNTLETAGKIPVLLPSPGLVTTTTGGLIGKAVGTVDTAVADSGQVVGDVVNTAGDVVGGVAGAVTGLLGGISGNTEQTGGA